MMVLGLVFLKSFKGVLGSFVVMVYFKLKCFENLEMLLCFMVL